MNMARFSKMVMVEHLEAKISRFVAEWKLDPSNGTAQLRGRDQDAYMRPCGLRRTRPLIAVSGTTFGMESGGILAQCQRDKLHG